MKHGKKYIEAQKVFERSKLYDFGRSTVAVREDRDRQI